MSLLQALADIATLQSTVSALQSSITSIQSVNTTQNTNIAALQSAVTSIQSVNSTQDSQISVLQNDVTAAQLDIASANTQNADQQNDIDLVKDYCEECSSCGQDEIELHNRYICTNCGYNRNRRCIAVCRVCDFRNIPLTTDPTRRECVRCHVAYKLTEFNGAATQCKQCDIIFLNYRNATKYYLDF